MSLSTELSSQLKEVFLLLRVKEPAPIVAVVEPNFQRLVLGWRQCAGAADARRVRCPPTIRRSGAMPVAAVGPWLVTVMVYARFPPTPTGSGEGLHHFQIRIGQRWADGEFRAQRISPVVRVDIHVELFTDHE